MQSQSHRQRARRACQPCRRRKRKCDGQRPCGTCVRYEYGCYFSASEKNLFASQRDALHESSPPVSPPSARATIPEHPAVLDPYKSRFVKANSSVAFPRLLGIELNSKNAPRLHSFAWNIGARAEPKFNVPNVTDYLSLRRFEHFSRVYFSLVHPVYAFIDEPAFTHRCRLRFSPDSKDTRIDPIIYGVVALGSLFSPRGESYPNEAQLVDLAKNVLEHTSIISSPNQDHVAAWILRTIYLRCTTRPHASWISSCTTMHLIEATGLHQEVSQIAIVSPAAPDLTQDELRMRRRLFWTAKSLNKMISHEYGRNCVKLSSMNVEPVSNSGENPVPEDQYIALSDILPEDEVNPYETEGQLVLHEAIVDLTKLTCTSHEIVLFRADLGFSIYRRMRLRQRTGQGIPTATISLIIKLGLEALPSSFAVAASQLPWWTVLSVPFMLVCILLAIDSRDSLSQIPLAMAALEEVGRHWDTHMVREAIGAAGLLVKLSRKRKEEDMRWLEEGMPKSSGPHGSLSVPMAADVGSSVDNSVTDQAGILVEGVAGAAAQIPGTTMPNSFDFIDGMDLPLPEDFSIDWNSFFDGMDWL